MKLYVEKAIKGSPRSHIGPFDNTEQAEAFIEKAMIEERRFAAAYGTAPVYDVCEVAYRIILKT